jgi:hypothetical protein
MRDDMVFFVKQSIVANATRDLPTVDHRLLPPLCLTVFTDVRLYELSSPLSIDVDGRGVACSLQ